MDLLQLKYFQTVARHEHMTHAAEELSIAQPSLSKMIARLEEELGVQLFERRGRQIRLNDFGKIFLKQVERSFFELEEGKRQIQDMLDQEHGHVAVSTVNVTLLAKILSEFCTQHPHISFRLYQHTNRTMIDQLERGEIDLCLTSPRINHPGIGWLSLITEEICLYVPKTHRLGTRTSIDLSEVANEPFVGVKSGYGLRDITDYYCQEAGFTPKIVFEGNEPGVIQGLVLAGLGLGFAAGMSRESLSSQANPRLQILRIDKPICRRTIGLAWLESRYRSKAVSCFRQFMIDYFANHQLADPTE
ncbi:LysR family transcriptional regulator [Dictyobacter arantiisoli]|uniref:LysR family transcriptional regulator n=1 Tax=Dictyobacter arantiisoli TaxID=2014874 RepID=A0A5A5T9Q4_9CHLR|nr:LysR family transcriptional regulator [Dictyobacter arantiisoli]GCF07719.1 LysR family transcriptional regulator [Dictyobacter arantiisoli]